MDNEEDLRCIQRVNFGERWAREKPLYEELERYEKGSHKEECRLYLNSKVDLINRYQEIYKSHGTVDLNAMFNEFVPIQERMNQANEILRQKREPLHFFASARKPRTPPKMLKLFFEELQFDCMWNIKP